MKIETIDLYQRANMKIGKNASSVEYRRDERFRNRQFLEPNFVIPNWNEYSNLLIFSFGLFQKFAIRKISRIPNLGNSNNFQLRKFQKLKIPKISASEHSKNFQFGKFHKCAIENSKNCQFWEFRNFSIWKIPKIS